METQILRWFQQVADGVSVTEVADVYDVSQPGVSRALARLEREVGTPLLAKRGRSLRLTHAGSVFKDHVDRVLHDLDDGMAAVEELLDPEAGTVGLAFPPSLGTWLVPGTIGQFRRHHPRVGFRLVQSHDAEAAALLASSQVDLHLLGVRPADRSLAWERILVERLVVAVPQDHPLRDAAEVPLARLADEELVLLRSPWELRRLTDDLLADAGVTPRVAFEADSLAVVRGFVAAGLGVAVVPSLDAQAHPSRGVHLVRLSDAGATREVGVAWSRERRLLPSTTLFRDWLLEGGRVVAR